MARRVDDASGPAAVLTELKAVDRHYPLYGEMRIAGATRPDRIASDQILVAPALAESEGGYERAARLWGAAEGMGAGSRPDFSECRPDDAPRVAAARVRLTAPACIAAWAAGATLTLAEAVAEALNP